MIDRNIILYLYKMMVQKLVDDNSLQLAEIPDMEDKIHEIVYRYINEETTADTENEQIMLMSQELSNVLSELRKLRKK